MDACALRTSEHIEDDAGGMRATLVLLLMCIVGWEILRAAVRSLVYPRRVAYAPRLSSHAEVQTEATEVPIQATEAIRLEDLTIEAIHKRLRAHEMTCKGTNSECMQRLRKIEPWWH